MNKLCEGKEIGTVTISIFQEDTTGSPLFFVHSSNEEVLPFSEVIENTLSSL